MRRLIPNLAVFVVLMMLFILPTTAVLGATSQDVAINATPAYVTITNSPDNYGFGTVATSTNYTTTQAYFNVTNGSTVNIDVAISCNATWASAGNTWTHNDAGTPGATTAALYTSDGGYELDIIVENASPRDLVTNQASTTDFDWELRLMSPTSFDDGVIKTNTVTLTATAT